MVRRPGYPFAVLSAAFSGAIAALGKSVLVAGANPLTIPAIVSLGAALILFPFAPRLKIPRHDLPLVLAIAALGGFTGPLLFYVGLQSLQVGGSPNAASVAALLVNTEVLFTILIAIALFRESGNRWEWLAVGLLGAGAVVVTTDLRLSPTDLLATGSANLFLILSYLAWGFDNNISRVLSERNNPLQLVWVKYVIGGIALLVIALLLGNPLSPPGAALPAVGALSVTYAVGAWSFYVALARLGAMRSISLFATSAAFGVLFAFLMLGERVTPIQLGGGLLMAVGVVLIARQEAGRVRRPELTSAPPVPGATLGEPLGGEDVRRP